MSLIAPAKTEDKFNLHASGLNTSGELSSLGCPFLWLPVALTFVSK